MKAQRIIKIINYRTQALIGIYEKEKKSEQPLQVDMQVNLGLHNLVPDADDIEKVLNYEILYQLIGKTLTESHSYLLETKVGMLAQSVMALAGVCGLRVEIRKLSVFKECEVGIELVMGDIS